jgi:tRNA 5-methylaminomethyl-2-thiouridine biosynthesis bifunctional protein
VRPGALVGALLGDAGVEWRGSCRVTGIVHDNGEWIVQGEHGELARAPAVVVAAAYASRLLVTPALALHPVRGQILWAPQPADMPVPASPVNGNGHFIPSVPTSQGAAWYCGSTYGRGDDSHELRGEDTQANIERLSALLPAIAPHIDAAVAGAWAQVRCTSQDRRPIVGELAPGLLVSTAMGSRGLTFSILGAELLAATVHREPLPLDERLARALAPKRGRAG